MYQCETKKDFKEFILSSLLPWLKCDSAVSAWMNLDLKAKNMEGSRLIDGLGIPENEYEVVEKLAPYYKNLLNLMANTSRLVIATDVDIPRESVAREVNQFFTEHPEYDRSKLKHGKMLAGAACVERPDLSVVFAFNRYSPNDRIFTSRDLRRLELLHPSLIHVIKVVSLNAELQTYKALVETMAEAEAPLVLIREDQRILFSNPSFKQIIPLDSGHLIPKSMAEAVEREARHLRADEPSRIREPRMAFYRLPQGPTFRLSLTHLNRPHDEADRCFLIRLHSTEDPITRLNLDLQKAALTPREMEAALLIRDGFDDGEIAERLFISVNTVRNHLKAIHTKLNIHSRQKLMSFLHSHK